MTANLRALSRDMSHQYDVHSRLQDTLKRNGMNAHIVNSNGQQTLVIQGHDSPMLTYNLTDQQYRNLTDGGTSYSNGVAYKTFVDIVKNDFDCPKNYVHARNVNSRMVMGLHGYREGPRVRPVGFGHFMTAAPAHFLGWTPRQQHGFHGRLVNGGYVLQDNMVPVRHDGSMRPGELTSGGYGFYWKGSQQQTVTPQVTELVNNIKEEPAQIRSTSPAQAWNGLAYSDMAATSEAWLECTGSHGIIIDKDKKTLTIQSESTVHDFQYTLTDAQVKALTSNNFNQKGGVSVNKRLDIINGIIKDDFNGKITKATLNSTNRVNLPLTASAAAEVNMRETAQAKQQNEVAVAQGQQPTAQPALEPIGFDKDNMAYVNGARISELNESKAWYREGDHGREVSVGSIWAEKMDSNELGARKAYNDALTYVTVTDEQERHRIGMIAYDKYKQDHPAEKGKAVYQMAAEINGQIKTKAISEKEYNRFMAHDDFHRMKDFSKAFPDVEMKTIPGKGKGMNFLQGLDMAFGVIRGLSGAAMDVGMGIRAIKDATSDRHHHHHPVGAATGGVPIFAKPGLDTPQTIAQRAFDVGYVSGQIDTGLHR